MGKTDFTHICPIRVPLPVFLQILHSVLLMSTGEIILLIIQKWIFPSSPKAAATASSRTTVKTSFESVLILHVGRRHSL